MSNLIEEWRPIAGYEGLYEVSDWGNIRSLDRVIICKSRWGKMREIFLKGDNLTLCVGTNGYYHAVLSKNGISKTFDVHPIVYRTFIGEIPDNMQVNHIDENKLNNRVENLNLLSPDENTNWKTHNIRVSKTKSKKVYQYDFEYNLINTYTSTKDAALKNGFDQASISACARGKKHCKTYKGYIWSYVPL